MADQNLYEAVKEFFVNIFTNETVAKQVITDPKAALDAYGITDYDDAVYRQAAYDASQEYDLPYGNQDALYQYSQGGQAPASYQVQAPAYTSGGQPAAQYQATGAEAVHHVKYATLAAYDQNPEIRNEIVNNFQVVSVDQSTSVDNSVNLDGNFDVDGDFNLTNSNATATGDDAVAVSGNDNLVATGDDAVLTSGDGNQIDIGDGDRIEVGDVDGTLLLNSEVDGNIQTATGGGVITDVSGNDNLVGNEIGERANVGNEFGDNATVGNEFGDNALVGTEVGQGALVNSPVDGPVNTGLFTGVQSGGDVTNPVIGDENQVANLDFNTSGGGGGNADAQSGSGGNSGDANADGGRSGADATSGSGGNSGDAGAEGGAGGSGDISQVTLNFGGGSNFTNNGEFELDDGSAFSLEGESSGANNSFNTEDSFNTEVNTEINQDTRIEDSQLDGVDLSQEAQAPALADDEADGAEVPAA